MKKFLITIFLISLAVPANAQFRYIGSGESMLPTIKPGTHLNVYPFVYTALKSGMLVTFDMEPEVRQKIYWDIEKRTWSLKTRMVGKHQKNVTHRLTRYVKGKGWKTKGDNVKTNQNEDFGYVTEKNLIGLAKVLPNN